MKYVSTKFHNQIIPNATVTVIYDHTTVVEIPCPQFVMLYGSVLTAQSEAKYRMGGEAEVNVKNYHFGTLLAYLVKIWRKIHV